METLPTATSSCCCTSNTASSTSVTSTSTPPARSSIKAVWSATLSFLIAFFPKCPVCWAAYMSLFSSVGLSKIPYSNWLLPLLCGMLLVHLFFIYKKRKQKGNGPFMLTLLGVGLLLLGRTEFIPFENYMLVCGIICMLFGSLWNNFTLPQFKLNHQTNLKHF